MLKKKIRCMRAIHLLCVWGRGGGVWYPQSTDFAFLVYNLVVNEKLQSIHKKTKKQKRKAVKWTGSILCFLLIFILLIPKYR